MAQLPKFDPSLLKKPHPRFGEVPKANGRRPAAQARMRKFRRVREIDAGAGRTIVKDDSGQVTVRHDDTERFRRLGGNVNTAAEAATAPPRPPSTARAACRCSYTVRDRDEQHPADG